MSGAKQLAKSGATSISLGAETTKRAARKTERQMVKKFTKSYVKRGRRQGVLFTGMAFSIAIGAVAAFFPRRAQKLLGKVVERRSRIQASAAAARAAKQEPQPGDRTAYPTETAVTSEQLAGSPT